ncbi:MAG: XRE family transcriptional regulator [Candidatus Poribacteria bacterium]|nr:XRE family transcriptional regulator [Candidatus Poribacteria bacterium]
MADYTLSSSNVFKDLYLPLPEERLVKAKLAHKINRLITMREMTQKEAANCMGISQYKMTQLRNGRLKSFTVDDLGSLLEKLECHTQLNAEGRTEKEHYVVANPDGGWDVVRGNVLRTLKHFETKKDAVAYGRQVSRNQKTEFVVCHKNGNIQRTNNH